MSSFDHINTFPQILLNWKFHCFSFSLARSFSSKLCFKKCLDFFFCWFVCSVNLDFSSLEILYYWSHFSYPFSFLYTGPLTIFIVLIYLQCWIQGEIKKKKKRSWRNQNPPSHFCYGLSNCFSFTRLTNSSKTSSFYDTVMCHCPHWKLRISKRIRNFKTFFSEAGLVRNMDRRIWTCFQVSFRNTPFTKGIFISKQ